MKNKAKKGPNSFGKKKDPVLCQCKERGSCFRASTEVGSCRYCSRPLLNDGLTDGGHALPFNSRPTLRKYKATFKGWLFALSPPTSPPINAAFAMQVAG